MKGVSGGRAVITVTTTNGKTDQCEVTVTALPEWIRFTEDQVEIGASQTHQLQVELNPGAASALRFESADGKVATVSDSGVVTGVAEGETVVTVYTSAEGVAAQVPVTVRPAPKSVKFKPATMTLTVGDTALLVPVITKGSVTGFTYSSSAPEVASVSEDGTLTALSRGEATVTVTTSNGLSAELKLTVTDPLYPESAKLTNAPSSMKEGETLQLKWKVEPAGAAVDFTWASSDANVAYADDAGMLYAVSMGYATITATSRRNTGIVLSFQVGVDGKNVVLTLPARITGTSAIQKNLDRIDAIRTAGIGQIDALLANGQITEADASRRRQIVNNVFKDYAFPWMTEEKQLYWKKENSQNGAKDFKKGKIYYGVPYTQDHRGFNVDKLLKQNYYTDSGKGYAVLNRTKIKSRDYRGSDCSSFVGAAIWGVSDSRGNDRTYEIMKSSDYKTIKGFENLRTGDLVCKGHEHVIMFLYFVNAEKTKMMIIQNGGNEHGSNTVNCMIMDVKYYTSRGYSVRRLKRLG